MRLRDAVRALYSRDFTSSDAWRGAVSMHYFRMMAYFLATHLNFYLLSRELTHGHWQDFEHGSSQTGFSS